MTKASPSPPAAVGPIWNRKKAWNDVVAPSATGRVRKADDASLGVLLVVSRITVFCASKALPL